MFNLKKSVIFGAVALLCSSLSLYSYAGEMKWAGCGISKKAYITALAKAFEQKSASKVAISGGGATKGIRATVQGSTDVGGTCRLYLKSAAGDVHAKEQGVDFVHVAWDALVPIANSENPVQSITIEQLKDVYDGKITNWKDLGGDDAKIMLITRDGKYSGVGHMFRKVVFNDQEYDFKAKSLKVKSTGPLEKKVASKKYALGVDGISSAKKAGVKILAISGKEASKENIASGSYGLHRPLYLTVKKDNPNKLAHEFIQFALSEEGQSIISSEGTVNLKEGANLDASQFKN